jgi:ABC-type lipoprotein export system ATPase subunit
MDELLKLEGIDKRYGAETEVLKQLSFSAKTGESVAIIGESGCGKSTLLNLIGTLDRPDAGSVCFEGVAVHELNEKDTAAVRNNRIGFVFQLHHLLPQCSVLDNVLVPTLVNGNRGDAKQRAELLLKRVGLSHRLSHRPGQLSGGERQRVALVRALINQPALLLADEPTGALNRAGADGLMELLLELNREAHLTIIMVTHSMRLAEQFDRVMTLENGQLK